MLYQKQRFQPDTPFLWLLSLAILLCFTITHTIVFVFLAFLFPLVITILLSYHEFFKVSLYIYIYTAVYNQLNTEVNANFLQQFNKDKEIDLLFDPNSCQTGNTSNTACDHTIEITRSNQPVSGALIRFTGNQMNDYNQNGAVMKLQNFS